MSTRRLFPYAYLVFITPLFFGTPTGLRLALLGAIVALALAIGPTVVLNVGRIAATSFITLLPFLIVVQWATCTSSAIATQLVRTCVENRSIIVLVNIGLATSIILLASANEWRGSLVATINGLNVPRDIKIMFAISGVLIGEFRKAISKVHHAFTSRGDAVPVLSAGNLFALPSMLAVVWASVLNVATSRLETLWGSDTFWERVVPRGAPQTNGSYSLWHDLSVLTVAGATLMLVIFSSH